MSRIESFDEGVEVGEARGVEKGHKQGREEGREEGRQEGREEGLQEGREEGRQEGIHLYVPIIKELLKGELSHAQIAERYSVALQLVDKLAEELN